MTFFGKKDQQKIISSDFIFFGFPFKKGTKQAPSGQGGLRPPSWPSAPLLAFGQFTPQLVRGDFVPPHPPPPSNSLPPAPSGPPVASSTVNVRGAFGPPLVLRTIHPPVELAPPFLTSFVRESRVLLLIPRSLPPSFLVLPPSSGAPSGPPPQSVVLVSQSVGRSSNFHPRSSFLASFAPSAFAPQKPRSLSRLVSRHSASNIREAKLRPSLAFRQVKSAFARSNPEPAS